MMANYNKIRELLFILIIIHTNGGKAQLIRFFENVQYKEYLYESLLTSNCETLPDDVKNKTSSVSTAECVQLFARDECTGKSFILDPTDGNALTYFNDMTSSFRPCNSANKPTQAFRIKLFEHPNFESMLANGVILKTCRNLGSSNKDKVSSAISPICVILFSQGDCKGAQYMLNANIENGNHSFIAEFNDEVDSFRPCDPKDLDVPKPVAQLFAQIVQVDFYLDVESDGQNLEPNEITIGPEGHLFNNGSAIITREYSLTQTLPETLILNKPKDLRLFSNLNVSQFFQSRFTSGIPTSIWSKLESNFIKAFQNTHTLYRNVEMKQILFNEKFQIFPCTWYRYTPVAKVVKNCKIFFNAKMEVSGVLGEKQMDQIEINEMLQRHGMEVILGETNSTESETEIKGTVILDFITGTAFVGNGGCVDDCEHITQ